jgi:hypothetical protein
MDEMPVYCNEVQIEQGCEWLEDSEDCEGYEEE